MRDKYDPTTYSGLRNRILDGVELTEGQKSFMVLSGLTEDNFKNQKTLEEKLAIINEARTI